MLQVSEVIKLRRKVLREVAKLTFDGTLQENVDEILQTVVTEEGPRYRCCVHKERAVLKHRIKLVLGQAGNLSLQEATQNALAGKSSNIPVVNVLPEACDQCPIDKFLVTNACRNCLAHNCIASCPRQAIIVVQNRAYIDKNKCVECGLCKKSCVYGAIIEVNRPCEGACDIGAIKANSARSAVIDYEKCVQCGWCKIACPFGAISDRGSIVQIIQKIKSDSRVYALLAPAFFGQFGPKVKPGQIVSAIKKAGFYDVREASFGADIVTIEEGKEFIARVPSERNFMTTSCCPAFVGMVEKHLPQFVDNISSTVSPMVAAATVIKSEDPEAVIVFVGPCVAKKVEADKHKDIVDFAVTFGELAALLAGAGFYVANLESEADGFQTIASQTGNGFACAGGVVKAVASYVKDIAPNCELKAHRSEGLSSCKTALQQIKAGKIDANFFEGMACQGGCVGGPGILADVRVSAKLLEAFAKSAIVDSPQKSSQVSAEINKGHHLHR